MLHDLPTKGGDFQYAGFYKSRFAESKAQRYGFREEKTVAEAKDLNHEGIATISNLLNRCDLVFMKPKT